MIDKFGMDELGRPCWDLYFMTLAFVVAQRSLDKSTKHGSIVVAEDNTILSIGYNGPARGRNDSKVPQKRPEKYDHFLHSESAAIINAARHGISLKGSIFYITGFPCPKCISEIINVGAKKVIYGGVSSDCVDINTQKIVREILIDQPVEFVDFKGMHNVLNSLNNTKKYIYQKVL